MANNHSSQRRLRQAGPQTIHSLAVGKVKQKIVEQTAAAQEALQKRNEAG